MPDVCWESYSVVYERRPAVIQEHRMTMIQQNVDITTQLPLHNLVPATAQPGQAAPTCDAQPGIDFYGHDLTGVRPAHVNTDFVPSTDQCPDRGCVFTAAVCR